MTEFEEVKEEINDLDSDGQEPIENFRAKPKVIRDPVSGKFVRNPELDNDEAEDENNNVTVSVDNNQEADSEDEPFDNDDDIENDFDFDEFDPPSDEEFDALVAGQDEAQKATAEKINAESEDEDEDEVVKIEADSKGNRFLPGTEPLETAQMKKLRELGEEVKIKRDKMASARTDYTEARDLLLETMKREGVHEYKLDTGETVKAYELDKLQIKKEKSVEDDLDLL